METVGRPIPEIPFVAPAAKKVAAMPANSEKSMRRVSAATLSLSLWMFRNADSARPKPARQLSLRFSYPPLGASPTWPIAQPGSTSPVNPNRSPSCELPQLTLSDRPADASSRRAALLVVALSAGVFLALAPLADMPLSEADWFIPLVQSALIINDLVTAALLFGQLRFGRQGAIVVLASGYVFSAVMAGIHMLTFPGVFSAGGLLGAGAQTTAYLYVFWHLGMPGAVLAYTVMRKRKQKLSQPVPAVVAGSLFGVTLLAAGLALLATWGNDLLSPMLDGIRYSSAFNIGRYGQWAVTAIAILVLWRRRTHSVLDVWLLVMLCDSFFEIALVSIFNAGRYDIGFYAGRVYAVLASSIVLVMLLVEHGKMYRELAGAQETARSEASLRESREVLRLAMRGGRMAAWTRDLEHRTTWWSPEVQELTGWPARALGASDQFFLERVHPADREEVRGIMDADAVPEGELAVEFRLRHADGSWRWLDARCQALPDEDGGPARLFGVAVDITVQKQSAEATAELEARFRALADGMPQLAWMARPDGWIYWYNRRWYEYTGTTFEEMEGWGWRSVHDPAVLPAVVEQIRRSFETGEVFEMVFPLRGADGEFRPFLTRMMPLKDGEGRVLAWFGTNTDITQQRAEEDALRIADRRKDEFIATLAHELRNPLAPIRTAVELWPGPARCRQRWHAGATSWTASHATSLGWWTTCWRCLASPRASCCCSEPRWRCPNACTTPSMPPGPRWRRQGTNWSSGQVRSRCTRMPTPPASRRRW